MRKYIRALSARAEFTIVVLCVFGPSIFSGVTGAIIRTLKPRPGAISEGHLHALLVYEIVVLGVFLTFLRLRDWTWKRIGLGISAKETLQGFGLAAADHVIYVAILSIAIRILPQIAEPARHLTFVAPGFSLPMIIATSLVNPVFEEVFVCGYLITALKERGHPWAGVNLSVAIRLLYHLYQGVIGIINVIPIGLIFSYWYIRTGRLWPVIAAHAILDFLSLLAHSSK